MNRQKKNAVEGALLRLERLKQHKEQKEVCYGICVPSYLCKIEKGQVQPDLQTLTKLFNKLGIRYETDEELLVSYGVTISEYFENLKYNLDTTQCYQRLIEVEQSLTYSRYAMEWLIIRCFQNANKDSSQHFDLQDCMALLEQLKEYMSPNLVGYYDVLYCYIHCLEAPNYEECLQKAKEAFAFLSDSFSLGTLCEMYLLVGDYTSIHQMENRFISIAIEEGNTYQLANYYYINGTAYACLMMEDMMISCYQRSIHLLQNTNWTSMFSAFYYNLGSTYLSLKKYDMALKYLEKADAGSLCTLRMKALTLIRQGKVEDAKEYLDQMKVMLQNNPDVYLSDHLRYEEACMECQENFIENPKYQKCIEKLRDALEKECHFGHLYFYADVIISTYMKQRKYRKALDFQQRISLKHK